MDATSYIVYAVLCIGGLFLYYGFHDFAVDVVNIFAIHPSEAMVLKVKACTYVTVGGVALIAVACLLRRQDQIASE